MHFASLINCSTIKVNLVLATSIMAQGHSKDGAMQDTSAAANLTMYLYTLSTSLITMTMSALAKFDRPVILDHIMIFRLQMNRILLGRLIYVYASFERETKKVPDYIPLIMLYSAPRPRLKLDHAARAVRLPGVHDKSRPDVLVECSALHFLTQSRPY